MVEAEEPKQETCAPDQGGQGDTPTEAAQHEQGVRAEEDVGEPEVAGGEGAIHGESMGHVRRGSLGMSSVATDEDLVYVNPNRKVDTSKEADPIDLIDEESDFGDLDYDGADENTDGGSETGSDSPAEHSDTDVIHLQAILADLPRHGGLYSPEASRGWCACVGGKPPFPCPAPKYAKPPHPAAAAMHADAATAGTELGIFTSADVVQAAVLEAAAKYPDFRATLGRLVVERADEDTAALVDHAARRIYLAVRGGPAPISLRDISNDALVVLGFGPARLQAAEEAYREVKQRFPDYAAYGCGQSLGGTIMHDLACKMSGEGLLAFKRVDVFNVGGSPTRLSRPESLPSTQYYSHRVGGDLVSLVYRPPNSPRKLVEIQHSGKPDLAPHRLDHFLPPRAPSRKNTPMDLVLNRFMVLFSCAASRKRDVADEP